LLIVSYSFSIKLLIRCDLFVFAHRCKHLTEIYVLLLLLYTADRI
jgi:hypothetical protein